MILAKRIANKIAKLGEEFSVNSTEYAGMFKILDSGTMRSYLNEVEIMGIVNPGYVLITTPDTVININDTILHDGRDYYVLRSVVHRVHGVDVFRLVVLG